MTRGQIKLASLVVAAIASAAMWTWFLAALMEGLR